MSISEYWAKYAIANTAIKILRDKLPVRLYRHLNETICYEFRSTNVIKFYDNLMKRIGRHALGNRLEEIFEAINDPITRQESDCSIRLLLKKSFFRTNDLPPIVPVGVCFNGPGQMPIMKDNLP